MLKDVSRGGYGEGVNRVYEEVKEGSNDEFDFGEMTL
jgi:hypothetical protein